MTSQPLACLVCHSRVNNCFRSRGLNSWTFDLSLKLLACGKAHFECLLQIRRIRGCRDQVGMKPVSHLLTPLDYLNNTNPQVSVPLMMRICQWNIKRLKQSSCFYFKTILLWCHCSHSEQIPKEYWLTQRLFWGCGEESQKKYEQRQQPKDKQNQPGLSRLQI